ncbi:sugar transferase [Sphingomonas rustica]|uniref:sugar transferase n=1 Tax=Sphingomonas rustica TaxID=3103142 RepID=UPI0031FDCCC9
MRFRLHLSLVLLDICCIFAGFFLAELLYPHAFADQWLTISLSVSPLYLAMAFGARAFSTEVIVNPGKGVARSMQAFVVAAAAMIFLAFSMKASTDFSRAIFVLGVGISALILFFVRALFLHRARSILGGNPYNIILISDRLAPPGGDYSVVLPASTFDPGEDCPIMYDRLATALKSADRVILDCSPAHRTNWIHALQGANVQAELLMPELNSIGPIALASYGGNATLVVAKGPLNLPDRILKRLFDIAVAGSAILLIAPVLILTAIAVKLESKGPVLFVQTRIGRGNKMFRMLKFRSMYADRGDGHGTSSTGRKDDRITRVGRVIRKTSIDELPQLINVLIGNMSIVGPRPHALGSKAEDQLFWEIDGRYWHRHAAKPGLTGLAQVRGFRGATDRRDDLTNRLMADLEYLHGWSIWRDIKIIAMTFGVVMHKNAF